MANVPYKKAITIENINPAIVQMQYAINGSISAKFKDICKDLNEGRKKTFSRVISANIGDCHALGQVPITFIRQVLACITYPELIKTNVFPEDVKCRAAEILNACAGYSVGSYSSSIGIEIIRRSVASYIEERDEQKAEWVNVCLCPGASSGIKASLQMLANNINGRPSGVMIPIPEYPLYSASVSEYSLTQVDYYLDESKNWVLTLEELERSFKEGSKTCKVRALVVINPGNPTGQVLNRENIATALKFAYKYSLIIIADEVYQHNIYQGKFMSFKKVLTELEAPYNQVELISLMSMSKGYMGECGLRGGWMEIVNMDPEVQSNMYKGIAARVCPNTIGQAVVDCVVRPPREGEPSYELFVKEKTNVLQSLHKKARIIVEMFENMTGFSCEHIQGGMYAFPRFELPPNAMEAAKRAGQEPDVFYAYNLLEETGICVLPGSAFGQKPGTYHIRTTILPRPDVLAEMVVMFQNFHNNFIKKYSQIFHVFFFLIYKNG